MPKWSDDCQHVDIASLAPKLRRLLNVATEVEPLQLSNQRQRLLDVVGEIVDADIGFWAWGVGHPLTDSTFPLALLHYRFTEDQKARMLEVGMDPAMNPIHQKIAAFFDEDRLLSVTSCSVFTADEWSRVPPYRESLRRLGMDSFLMTVRYSTDESWSNFFLMRREGRPDFTPHERWLAALALSGIPSLQSTAVELPAAKETIAGLSPRQRTVAVMLLDGLSRKQIATQLQLSEHTISDYIKLIYRQLGVHSLNELAARLLRDT